jgi:hypothetical protein
VPIVPRIALLGRIRSLVRSSPVTALLGPRQSGKTTLARQVLAAGGRGERFDLEDPRDLQRLHEPMTALEGLRGLVVIDEIQRAPELFPVLRVLADRRPLPARFVAEGASAHSGTWHCRQRTRSGCDVRISGRAAAPAWQDRQASRSWSVCGIVGGAPGVARAPRHGPCGRPVNTDTANTVSAVSATWH